jgi:enamine deaminase RidA (YjgF/YER057c/UK114 family)
VREKEGALLPTGARIIRSSGQLGRAADGSVPESFADQVAICFANIRAFLAECGTGVEEIGHVPAELTDRTELPVRRCQKNLPCGGAGRSDSLPR